MDKRWRATSERRRSLQRIRRVLFPHLTAFYPLDEASGDRADAHGGYTLTDVNTVGSATDGAHGVVAEFVKANTEYLEHSLTPAAFDFGATGKSAVFAGFVKVTQAPASGAPDVLFWGQAGAVVYGMGLDVNSNGTSWRMRFNAGGLQTLSAGVTVSIGERRFVMMYRDAQANEYGVKVEGGSWQTFDASAVTPVDLSSAGVLRIGMAYTSPEASDSQVSSVLYMRGDASSSIIADAKGAFDWLAERRRTYADLITYTGG